MILSLEQRWAGLALAIIQQAIEDMDIRLFFSDWGYNLCELAHLNVEYCIELCERKIDIVNDHYMSQGFQAVPKSIGAPRYAFK